MNIPINKDIINSIVLNDANSYLGVYISHQLNYNPDFHKQDSDSNYIFDNFKWLYKQNNNDFIFLNNLLEIMIRSLQSNIKNTHALTNAITTNDVQHVHVEINNIISIVDSLIVILGNTTHHEIIFKLLFELLNPLMNNILLTIFDYFLNNHTQCDDILSKMSIIFEYLGTIYVENYIYILLNTYKKYSLNNLNLDETVLNEYKYLTIIMYILSYSINNRDINYNEVYQSIHNISFNNEYLKINMYSTFQSTSPQTATPQTATPQTATPQTATPQTATPQTTIPQTAIPQTATNRIKNLLSKSHNYIMYRYTLYLYKFILMPLHYKCIQMKEDILILTNSISDVNNRYLYNATYNELFLGHLERKKKKLNTTYNHVYTLIYNNYLHEHIITIYNNIYYDCLYNNIDIELYIIECSIQFITIFYNNQLTLNNIKNIEYILLGFFSILNDNTIGVNIYHKCLIVNILTLNKKIIIDYFLKVKPVYMTLFLTSIINIYKTIEMNKTYDKEDKFVLRYNIHRIINQLLQHENSNIVADIFVDAHIHEMLFLSFQDLNYFFEYILHYIKYRSTILNNNAIVYTKTYSLYFKEIILLIESCVVYDKSLLNKQNINNILVNTLNTYVNRLLNQTVQYIYFNFNNINIYFSWKIDLFEKINTIYGEYKHDTEFCRYFLSENSNYNSNKLKQIDLFIDTINKTATSNDVQNQPSNIDILVENIAQLEKSNDSQEDIPDKFIDPILMTCIKEPILLPDSNMIVDKNMIYNHLLLNNSDPFCNTYLDKKKLIEYNNIAENVDTIQKFKEEYNEYRASIN